MKFICKKDSETGKKIREVQDQLLNIHIYNDSLSEEYGFDRWFTYTFPFYKRISKVIFNPEKKVNKKIWKYVKGSDNEYVPRMDTPEGRIVEEKISKTPILTFYDMNMCIGFDDEFKSIGLQSENPDYWGIIVKEDWDIKMPLDCEEVTTSKFNEMFNIEN